MREEIVMKAMSDKNAKWVADKCYWPRSIRQLPVADEEEPSGSKRKVQREGPVVGTKKIVQSRSESKDEHFLKCFGSTNCDGLDNFQTADNSKKSQRAFNKDFRCWNKTRRSAWVIFILISFLTARTTQKNLERRPCVGEEEKWTHGVEERKMSGHFLFSEMCGMGDERVFEVWNVRGRTRSRRQNLQLFLF
jgi:hypothetical protein